MPPVGRWRGHKAGEVVEVPCVDCPLRFRVTLHANGDGALYATRRCNSCRRRREECQAAGLPFTPIPLAERKVWTRSRRQSPLDMLNAPPPTAAQLAEAPIEALVEALTTVARRLDATNRTLRATNDKLVGQLTDATNRLRAVEAIFRARQPDAVLGRPELGDAILPAPKNGAHP